MNSLSFCLTHLAHSFGRGMKCLFYQLQGTIVQLFRNIGNQQYAEYRMLCENDYNLSVNWSLFHSLLGFNRQRYGKILNFAA